MAISKFSVSLLLCILFLFFTFPNSASSLATSDAICDSTPYPSFCKSCLPSRDLGDTRNHARYFMNISLSSSTSFVSSVLTHLHNVSDQSTVYTLQDCYLLSDLNVDFWSKTIQTLNSTDNISSSKDDDDLETLISATLTNYETCLDSRQGVKSTSDNSDLQELLSNGTKLYSISLSLFKSGWAVNASSTERKLSERKQATWEQRVYEVFRGRGRKLLEYPPDNVTVSQTVVVNPDGSGNFTTINDAVNAAPNNTAGGNGFFVIYVVAGVYEEYVSIPKNKKYLMMIGDGINQTIITGNRSVDDGWTTFNSATFAVVGQGFVAMNITFRNTAGAIKHQAVALRSGADLSVFYNCSFEGYQDTLYTHSLRQFYTNCDIYGTVDFIFGNAAVVLQNCNIYPRLPLSGEFNAITAQGRTDVNQNTGTSIHNCTITAASDLATNNGTTQTYLGRPWKQYSRTVYMQSFMDSLINPLGWKEWSGDFALDTLYYAEFDNRGPGSDTSGRVTWPGYHVINDTNDAVPFTVSQFIVGDYWIPATGVPYTGGLM